MEKLTEVRWVFRSSVHVYMRNILWSLLVRSRYEQTTEVLKNVVFLKFYASNQSVGSTVAWRISWYSGMSYIIEFH